MAEINAFSNAQLSREMYTALFKNTQAYYLVGEILADGKVNPNTGTKDGQSDAAALGKLRAHLEAAAKAGHNKLTPQDTALLNALDASSRDGASADVVLENLRKIQDLQKQVAEKGLDPTQVSFELRTQTYAEKVQGSSHALTLAADTHAAEPEGGVCKVTPGATAGNLSDLNLAISSDCQNNYQEEMARQHLISPIRVAQGQAVQDLANAADAQLALLKKPAQTPDSKLKQDLVGKLAGLVDGDKAYVTQVLDSLGLKTAELTKRGVLKAGDPDGLNNQRLQDFLASDAFGASLTPAAVNGYRKLLTDTLSAYSKDPSEAHFNQLREVIYDHSYVFESPEGVGEQAVDDYARMKELILNVSQQSNLLEKVTKPENLPASISELGNDIRNASRSADSDAQCLVGQIGRMLDQIDAHPELFTKVDAAGLRAQLDALVKRDDKGQPAGLKVSPPGQEQLNTLNHIWAKVEAVGLQAGLGDDFSQVAIGKALDQAVAKDPKAAEDPAVKLLKAAPELSEYSDLLSSLSKPENKPLLEAVLNNKGPEVSKYFSEYYSSYFDFSSMLGSIGSGVGTALSLGGGLLGGAIGIGLSYGKSLFNTDKGSTAPGAAGAPAAGRFSFGNFSLNLPAFGAGTADDKALKQSLDPSGKNMKLLGVSQTDVEAVMKLLAAKPEARALLASNGSDLNQLLKASPAGADLRATLDAKQAFDAAFWSNSSSLEDTQASIQGAMAAQTNARISLTQAGLAVKSALESKTLEPEVRQLLEGQQGQLDAALKAVEAGSAPPAGSEDLDRTIAAVKAAHQQAGVTASEQVLASARQYVTTKSFAPQLKELEAAFANGQMQQLLDKLPPAQRDQLRPLISGRDGKLNGESLLRRMHTALETQGTNPDIAQQIGASLTALTGLVHKANEAGATAADLAAYGRQPLETKAPLPGSPFDMLSDMKFMQDSMRDLRATLGHDAMGESAGRFVSDAREIMQDLAQKRPGEPVDRKQLYAKMRESLNAIKSQSLNQSLLEGLDAVDAPAEPAAQGPSVTEGLYSNPLMQNALQNVFSRANQGLINHPELKPLLARLAQGNATAMTELQAVLDKSGGNPAALNQEMQALLARNLPPADAQRLQSALLGEIDKQLGQTISQAEKTLGNYSRTDTRKAQSEMIESLKAYQGLLSKGQELEATEGRVRSAASETVKGISQGAGELLGAVLPEGVKPKDMFYKIFPSLLQHEHSDRQLLEDLSGFLALDRAGMASKLGVSHLSDEQYLAIQLAAGSLATARSLQDPNRGPAAAALAHLVQDVIAHPELLKRGPKRQQLQELLAQAGEIHNATGRDQFLRQLQGIAPEAAKAGLDLVADRRTLNGNLQAAHNLAQPNRPPVPAPTPPTKVTNPANSQPASAQNPAATSGSPPVPSVPAPSVPTQSVPADQAPVSDLVDGLATGLHLKPADLPAGTVQDATGAVKIPIRASGISPEFEARLFRAGTHAIANSLNTYLDLDSSEQARIRDHSAIGQFSRKMAEQVQAYEQTAHTEARHSCTLLEECKQRWEMYQFLTNRFADLLAKHPEAFEALMREAMDKLNANFLSSDQRTDALIAKADELAKQMLAPAPTPELEVKLSDAVMDYLGGIRNQPPQVQQLALADLAQKMITSAIHSFYDKAAQESNKRQFRALEAMAANLHKQIDAELRKSLARHETDQSDASSPGLSQGLKTQLENLLSEAQQMTPPMLTDFKRHQILQALFDGDPANDARGILALAGRHA